MTLVVIWAHEQLLGGGRCVIPVVVVVFVVIAVVSSSAFAVVCSLSRSSPSSLAGPGARRSCRPCRCRPCCPRCPHCPSAGPPWCHCPRACRPLVLASSRLPVVVLIVPFLAVVVLVVLMVHCGRCRSFAFLVVVGAVLVISIVSAVAGLRWCHRSRRPGPARHWCWGVCCWCRLALFPSFCCCCHPEWVGLLVVCLVMPSRHCGSGVACFERWWGG